MMDTLRKFLCSRVKAELLRLLFGLDARQIHLRELARRANLNDATVRQELKRMTELGLVTCSRDGNRTYCRANIEHPIYYDLRNMVLKTSGLKDILADVLRHSKIRIAFVFGSLAAGTEKAHSDVDLMVIGDVGLRDVSRLLGKMKHDIGRELNPHVLTADEFARRVKASDHFLTSVLDEPKLFVVGDERELGRLAE
jgi:DNA-binding transcriptional ArsR family regulator